MTAGAEANGDEHPAAAAMAACLSAKGEGNSAYASGDLQLAVDCYTKALSSWDDSVKAEQQPKGLEVGQLVRYDKRNFFGEVMSCFPLFDEYFLKDLGSDKAIWVGDAGGTLRRFNRDELHCVNRSLLDARQAIVQNLSAVHLKREAWYESIKWADAALVIEGRAPKALLRKGAALLQVNQPGPASDVLATAQEVVPKDIEVRRLLREAEFKRSPFWVCVKGCCGPWGIVCGGPVTSGANAIVVAPADKPAVVDAPDPEISFKEGLTTAPIDDEDNCSSCSSDEGGLVQDMTKPVVSPGKATTHASSVETATSASKSLAGGPSEVQSKAGLIGATCNDIPKEPVGEPSCVSHAQKPMWVVAAPLVLLLAIVFGYILSRATPEVGHV